MTSNHPPTGKKSAEMALVRSKDTGPEMTVRRVLYALGVRFRLHCKDLPGTPDVVIPSRRVALRVHGCFWHGHDCARGSRKPKTNVEYWTGKVARNVARDIRTERELDNLGWKVVTIWECELRDRGAIPSLLLDRLPPKIDI